VAHSLVANALLVWPKPETETAVAQLSELQLGTLIEWLSTALVRYLGREPSASEKTRYATYVACCLLGNLRYQQWTPDAVTFFRTVAVLSAVLDAEATQETDISAT
jgi:hypothetical protein